MSRIKQSLEMGAMASVRPRVAFQGPKTQKLLIKVPIKMKISYTRKNEILFGKIVMIVHRWLNRSPFSGENILNFVTK